MLLLTKDINNIPEKQNVIIVGNILEIINQEKYIDLRIDDNSNVSYMRLFKNENFNENLKLKEGENVIIIGYINEYKEKKRVNIRKIKKINEIEYLYWKIKSFKINNYNEKIETKKDEIIKEKNLKEKEILKENIEKIDDKELNNNIEIEDLIVENIQLEENLENNEKFKKEKKELNGEKIENEKEYVLSLIKNYGNDLIPIEEIISTSKLGKNKTEKILNELIEEGEIYEPKIGFIKILEI